MRIELENTTLDESLHFFRIKGTEFLRETLPPAFSRNVMIFEYRFDPEKPRDPINYKRANIAYGDALKEVLQPLGLIYQIQSIDRIAIMDKPSDDPISPEEAAARAKWPKTVDEAVERLLIDMKPADKLELKKKTEDELSSYHFSIGRYIRNSYGLWDGNEALLRSAGEDHPDNASAVIVHALWKKLQGPKPK